MLELQSRRGREPKSRDEAEASVHGVLVVNSTSIGQVLRCPTGPLISIVPVKTMQFEDG